MKTEQVTTLERKATQILAEVRDSGEAVLIVERGKPSAYLVDADSFEFMQERMQVLEGIARGERAVFEGRVCSQDEARQRMKKWLG